MTVERDASVNPHVSTWVCLLWRHREARVFAIATTTDNIATAYPKNRVPEGPSQEDSWEERMLETRGLTARSLGKPQWREDPWTV